MAEPRAIDVRPDALAARAVEHARAAAARSGVEIVPVADLDLMAGVATLFGEVWGTGGRAALPTEVLRAAVHAGSYAAAAFADGLLAGAVFGFLGRDEDGPFVHSHILAVASKWRGRDIGSALKLDQRAWSLARGMRKVAWTFDPLVRRNAHFNLQKLGAHATDYYENFYGPMRDGINAGDESDRLHAVWLLDDERAVRAAEAALDEPLAGDAPSIVEIGADGEPRACAADAAVVLCPTPSEVVELRKSSPVLARRWRAVVRCVLGGAMARGYVVTGFLRSGQYVLERRAA